ncbi:transketolase [[Clostridium] cellulosi]
MEKSCLKEKAKTFRQDIIKMLYASKSGHPGGSLSCVELLTALYFNKMRIDPKNPKWDDRDRFIMSKGHAAPTLYAILADLGYFPKSDLNDLRKIHSHLQGHPDMKKTPGVDMCTGSLGQGVSVAVGMALAGKYRKKDYNVYALLGDGELQEGLVWEASMAAAHYKLDNLTIIIDHNGLQIDGSNDDVMSLGDLKAKFEAFGFKTIEIDGHDFDAITAALNEPVKGQPKCIIAQTVKGKGVSFMENNFGWHGKAIGPDDYKAALAELEVRENG